METKNTKEIYSSLDKVWPENNTWYSYLHNTIINYIENNLTRYLSPESVYLNAGSGGSVYKLPGTCYHLDIAPNLIDTLPNSYVGSIEHLPFDNAMFDAIICVGSVINYCSALESISEFSRTLKPGGILVLEFERSQSAELWFSKEYCKNATLQQYDYLDNIHTLWLYSESYISTILKKNSFSAIEKKRLHTISAVINKFFKNENLAGKYGHFDFLFFPISYFTAHNIIVMCKKI